MGKSAGGAIWLDAGLLSPYDFYQYWVNCDDRDVERFLLMFTFLPLDEIARLAALEEAELREAKRILAYEATRITHGEVAARKAESAARAAFGGQGELDAVPTTIVSPGSLEKGMELPTILADAGLAASRGSARRLIQQGGAYVNEQRIEDVNYVVGPADLTPDGILLRAGKKKVHRLVVQG